MRGLIPKSPEIRKIQGTSPKKRNTAADTVATVAPTAELLAAPPSLDGIAREEWDRLAPLLADRGMFTPLDRNTLELYCEHWQLYRVTTCSLRQVGLTVSTSTGGVKQSPPSLALETLTRALRGLAGELGLHYLSRSRMGIKEPETKVQEWGEFV